MMFEQVDSSRGEEIRFVSDPDHYQVAKKVSQSVLKRAFDFALALMALTFLFPAFVIIAILIKLDSEGPVFFRQKRTGLNGQMFNILKFRSMTVQENGHKVVQAKANDKRVTRVGKFLRRTSLDELPQLINILKGDMSIVGPRPHALAHDIGFSELVPSYNERFHTRPGLTGLAQVRGYRGEIHTKSDVEVRIGSDVEYIKNWTFSSDIIIIARTVPLIFGDKKAY